MFRYKFKFACVRGCVCVRARSISGLGKQHASPEAGHVTGVYSGSGRKGYPTTNLSLLR